jgi:hypothetical protein
LRLSKGAAFDFKFSRRSKWNEMSQSRTWVPHPGFLRVGIVTWEHQKSSIWQESITATGSTR